jgi:hypothetical protein
MTRISREARVTVAAETARESGFAACWCCGGSFPEDRLVRLGDRPEVAVCFACAGYLNRRARESQPTSSANRRLRALAEATRRMVTNRGWHRAPVIGRALRWLDDRSPW